MIQEIGLDTKKKSLKSLLERKKFNLKTIEKAVKIAE
jgi:hypothetical protein